MWAFCSEGLTVYSIQPGRGYEQAVAILGTDFGGFLVRDGWIVYQRFLRAFYQTCLAHLLRRCQEMLEVARPGAAALPRTVKGILQAGLQLRGSEPDQCTRLGDCSRPVGSTSGPNAEP
jgi:hypothetical protein